MSHLIPQEGCRGRTKFLFRHFNSFWALRRFEGRDLKQNLSMRNQKSSSETKRGRKQILRRKAVRWSPVLAQRTRVRRASSFVKRPSARSYLVKREAYFVDSGTPAREQRETSDERQC
jgi:hypothetical protein